MVLSYFGLGAALNFLGGCMDTMKQVLKSRTMMFALALAILGAVETQAHLFSKHMTPELFGLFNILLAVVIAVLRVLTTVPLNEK